MAGVFVSYAREDAAKARAVATALEQAAFEVWFDERLHSGSEYSREIEDALKQATAVVVLWSNASVGSPWVRDEAAEGRDSGRLVPVVLDHARPPIGFRQFQTTDLSGWSGRGRPRQLDAVIAAVSAKAGSTPPPSRRAQPNRLPSRRIEWAIGFVALVAFAVGALFFVATRKPRAQQPSLAVLSFSADGSEPEAQNLAAQLHDSVVQTLSQGAYSVSSLDAAPRSDTPTADFVMSGQVSSTPQKFLMRVRLEETSRHIVMFSHQFDGDRRDLADLPERIGAQVASQVSWTAPLIAMEMRHPSDPTIARALLGDSSTGLNGIDSLTAYQNAKRLAASAPSSPLAQLGLAFNAALSLDSMPLAERGEAVRLGRAAADRARALAPEFGEPYAPWCLLRSEQLRIQCEEKLRTAMRLDPDAPFANWFLATRVLEPAGRIRDAADLAQLSLAHDPYMPMKIALAVEMLELTGKVNDADQLYRKGRKWWPDNKAIPWFRLGALIERGDFAAAERLHAGIIGPEKTQPVFVAASLKSLPALKSACSAVTEADLESIVCMLALAANGDLAGSFSWADKLYPSRRGRSLADLDRIWLAIPDPTSTSFLVGASAAPLRRDPRYLRLAERVGLVDYWRSGRLPDFCTIGHEPICSQLRRTQ